jgi:hypothetical protein
VSHIVGPYRVIALRILFLLLLAILEAGLQLRDTLKIGYFTHNDVCVQTLAHSVGHKQTRLCTDTPGRPIAAIQLRCHHAKDASIADHTCSTIDEPASWMRAINRRMPTTYSEKTGVQPDKVSMRARENGRCRYSGRSFIQRLRE